MFIINPILLYEILALYQKYLKEITLKKKIGIFKANE